MDILPRNWRLLKWPVESGGDFAWCSMTFSPKGFTLLPTKNPLRSTFPACKHASAHTHIAQNRANDHSTEMHRAGLTTGSYSCSSWTFPNLPVLLHSCVLFHLISRLLLAVTIDGLIHKGIPSSKPPTQMSQQLPQGHPPTCSTRTSSA